MIRKCCWRPVSNEKTTFCPVILAGGRGTRFWPLSRKRRAKQLLALDGKTTMIQQTVARLLPMARANCFWIITNEDSEREITRQLPKLDRKQIIASATSGLSTLGDDLFGITDPLYYKAPQRAQDIDQAKSLLKAAGQENLTITLDTADAGTGMAQSALIFSQGTPHTFSV